MDSPGAKVRSIFFFNHAPEIGTVSGLHFFEMRYRLLVLRALHHRQREFVWLPNFINYQAAHGDIGYLATIVDHRPVSTGDPSELPRADVQIRFDRRVMVLFHWMESSSGGLSECVCVPVDDAAPMLEEGLAGLGTPQAFEAPLNWPLPSTTHVVLTELNAQQPYYLLRSTRVEDAEATLQSMEEQMPSIRGVVYPIILPPLEDSITMPALLHYLAALWLRLRSLPSSGLAGAAAIQPMASPAPNGDGPLAAVDLEPPHGCERMATSAAAPLLLTEEEREAASSTLPTEEEREAAVFKSLPLRELRMRLAALNVSPSAACLEKDDLVALLANATRNQRFEANAAEAADSLSSSILGLRVPVCCGCPSPGLIVTSCFFARQNDSQSRLRFPRTGSLWGSQHPFNMSIGSGQADGNHANLGQVVAAVYDWERRHLPGFGDGGGLYLPSVDAHPSAPDASDPCARLSHACTLTLGVSGDEDAAALLPPNLVRVDRTDARRAVATLARRLHWSRVRLLFIGHQEGAAQTSRASGTDGDGPGDQLPADGRGDTSDTLAVCRFSRLDRELLWLIAEWIIALECKPLDHLDS